MDKILEIRTKFNKINHSLDERSRRLWAASEAISIGRGGITIVFKAIGLAKTTISRGIIELETDKTGHLKGKIRKIGAGRKRLENIHENLLDKIEALVDPETRGDPESPLRWTTKSTRNISDTLKRNGINISHEKTI